MRIFDIRTHYLLKMRRITFILCVLLLSSFSVFPQGQTVEDNFEGSGTITTWYGDDCGMNNFLTNLYQQGINTSNTVLEYSDTGGQYANVGFDVENNFDLQTYHTFTLKIYVPTNGITGSQTNQISLKLQDGTLGAPWATQSEIIKPVVLDQWQEVAFDFAIDPYINLDGNSLPPVDRTDFNRIVLQINGENNTDYVLAYLDDFLYDGTIDDNPTNPVFDNLVWSDEFDNIGAINSTNWFHQTQLPAGGSWYNGEVQHYTNRVDNTYVSDGSLKVVAKKETFNDQGYTKGYTSARLNSKFAFTYGRIEVRAKLPMGVGTWPAIWMLGKNINEDGAYWDNEGYGATNWPACGEIDIMEHWGSNQNYVQSAMHTPSSYGGTINHGGQSIPTASNQFHVYTLDWSEEKMVFRVDGVEHYTYNPTIKNSNTWPFVANQYLLLNIAIQPSIDPSFIQSSMEIDYVRIYQESALSIPEQNNLASAKLFPNPVKDKLTIQVPSTLLGAKATIYSALGQELKSFVQKESRMTVDLSHYKTGIYIVKFATNKNTTSYKFIKI